MRPSRQKSRMNPVPVRNNEWTQPKSNAGIGMSDHSTSTLATVIARVLRDASPDTGRSDGELVTAFVERRSSSAFAELVRRHGPMVLGVCLRILRHAHDAEDAFQATFLVLARKAASVSPRG